MNKDYKDSKGRSKDKFNPDYRNKYYEMYELNKQNSNEAKTNSTKQQTKFSGSNNNNTNKLNNKTDLSFSIFDNKSKNQNLVAAASETQKTTNQTSKYYQKTASDSENFLIKSSNQLMQHRIIRTFFSKKKFLNILGIQTENPQMNIYARYWKLCDSLMILSNFFIMIFAFLDYEINFSYPRSATPKNAFFRYLIFLIALFAIVCVICRHYYKQKWKNPDYFKSRNYYSSSASAYQENQNNDFLAEDEDEWFLEEQLGFIKNKFPKFFKLGLFIDILVNLLVPNPFFDFIITSVEIDGKANEHVQIEYLYSDLMFIFIVIRIIYLVRATINYSIFTDNYANSISKELGVSCNIRFALKCILKTHHIKIVILFFLASNIIFGFVLRVFERPFWALKGRLEFEYLSNSVWLVFITMLTIGYGDFVPYTFGGRMICMLAGLWGTFICSLVVVCLYGLFDLSNDQFLVFVKIVKGRSAIKFIESAYLLRRKRVLERRNKNETKDDYDGMIQSFNEFKNMRNESKSIYRSNGLLFYNMKLLKEMKKVLHKFDKLEYDVEGLGGYREDNNFCGNYEEQRILGLDRSGNTSKFRLAAENENSGINFKDRIDFDKIKISNDYSKQENNRVDNTIDFESGDENEKKKR